MNIIEFPTSMQENQSKIEDERLSWQKELLRETILERVKVPCDELSLAIIPAYDSLSLMKRVSRLNLIRLRGGIYLDAPRKSIKDVARVLKKASNSKPSTLCIACDCRHLCSPQKLLPLLSKCSPKITQQVILSFLDFNEKQLKRIFSAVRHTPNVQFSYCRIYLSGPSDFTRCFTSCKIRKLELYRCGSFTDKGWGDYPEQFAYLICGLSTPEFISSLRTFVVRRSNLAEEDFMTTINKYWFGQVVFEGDFDIYPKCNNEDSSSLNESEY